MERWFPLPDLYSKLYNQETLLMFAKAYMLRNYPKWTPIKINQFRVLAQRPGDKDGDV